MPIKIRSLAAALLVMLGVLILPRVSMAVPINIDFGNFPGLFPSSTFGAASGQTGQWNNITSFNTLSGIVDISGGATSVSIAITANTMGGWLPIAPGDAGNLMGDNFFSSGGGSWTVLINGLIDGVYDAYLYEPHNGSVGTGAGTINGISFADINGNFGTGTFIQSSNYHLISGVAISGGGLTITGAGGVIGVSGLAGMQLVQDQTVVPEPATLLLMGMGLAVLGFARRKRDV